MTWHAPRTIICRGRPGRSPVFGAESRADARLGAGARAHDRVGHRQQRLRAWIRSRAGHARPSAPRDRHRRVAVRAGRRRTASARFVRQTICRSKVSVDAFEWLGAARESQGTIVLGGRSSVMSVAARDARARRPLRPLARRRRRHQPPRVADASSAPRPTCAASRFASTASTLAWPASRRSGSKVCISAAPSTSGCRCAEASLRGIDRSSRTLLGARAAAPGRVSRSGAGRRERGAERRRRDRRAALHRHDAGNGGRHVAHRHAARRRGRRGVLHRVRQRRLVPAGARLRPLARDLGARRARRQPRPARADNCSRTASSSRWPAARSACCWPCGRRTSFRRSSSSRMPSISCSRRISPASSWRPPRVPASPSRAVSCRSSRFDTTTRRPCFNAKARGRRRRCAACAPAWSWRR